jgi:hypothetical protein
MNFNYLGYNVCCSNDIHVNTKLYKFQTICGTIIKTFTEKVQGDSLLKFYKMMAVLAQSYWLECWTW